MKRNCLQKLVTATGCALLLLSGCGSRAVQTPPAVQDSSADGSSTAADYLTLAEIKSIVLENAGLTEDEVRFVRTHLDSEKESARYHMEFFCVSAEYDYYVDAATGEILSMSCEAGSFDLAADLSDTQSQTTQNREENTTGTQSGTAQNPDENTASTQASISQSQGENMTGTQSDTAQNPDGKNIDNATADSQQAGSAGSAQTKPQYIGTEAAKQSALNHAGLKSDEVNFVHARLESDDGIWQYDIEFHKDTTEYDYEIDALTGEVLSFDHDAEYYHHAQTASADSELIAEEEAKQLALAHAGVAEKDAQQLRVKFDYDDGRPEYEVEWHVGRTEYSCDVDAVSGAILSYDKEFD